MVFSLGTVLLIGNSEDESLSTDFRADGTGCPIKQTILCCFTIFKYCNSPKV